MRVNNLWSKGLKILGCSNRVNLAQCQAKSKRFHQRLLFTFAVVFATEDRWRNLSITEWSTKSSPRTISFAIWSSFPPPSQVNWSYNRHPRPMLIRMRDYETPSISVRHSECAFPFNGERSSGTHFPHGSSATSSSTSIIMIPPR